MVVDASVLVAIENRQDGHHAAAAGWYGQALTSGTALHAPWILLVELAAALGRGLGSPVLAERAVDVVLHSGQWRLLDIDETLALRAAALAAQHRFRGGDAVYVALAATLGEPLVTFDREQAERAAAVVTVLVPGHGG